MAVEGLRGLGRAMTEPDLQSPSDYVCICHTGLSLSSLLMWQIQALTLVAFDLLLWAHSSGFMLCLLPPQFERKKASSNTSCKSLALSILVFFPQNLFMGLLLSVYFSRKAPKRIWFTMVQESHACWYLLVF